MAAEEAVASHPDADMDLIEDALYPAKAEMRRSGGPACGPHGRRRRGCCSVIIFSNVVIISDTGSSRRGGLIIVLEGGIVM